MNIDDMCSGTTEQVVTPTAVCVCSTGGTHECAHTCMCRTFMYHRPASTFKLNNKLKYFIYTSTVYILKHYYTVKLYSILINK